MRFFLALMHELKPQTSSNFVDIGSGRGQLVLAAAREGNWKSCVGIEIEKYEPIGTHLGRFVSADMR